MAHLIESIRSLSAQAVGPWLNGMLGALLLTCGVWLALRWAHRLNAATRHLIWGVTLIAVAGLSFPRVKSADTAGAIRPAVMPEKIVKQRDTVTVVAAPVLTGPIETTVESKPAINSASPMVNTASAAKLVTPAVVSPMKQPANPWQLKAGAWLMVLPCVWLTGTLLLLIRIVYALAHLRRLKRNTTPLPEELQAQLSSCPIPLRCSAEINMPLAAGLTHPVVLIPTKLVGQLNGEELRQVVMHECAHLRRHDDWTNLVQQLLAALFWVQPAVWFINRQMIREREIACDDQVICQHGDARPYALCLTRLAELTQLTSGPLLASGAIFSQGELARRVALLLDRQRNASTKLSWATFIPGTALLGIAVVAITHLAPIAVVAEPVKLAQAANPATVSTTPPAALPQTTAKAGDKERALIEEEIKLVEQQVANAEVAMKTGRENQDDVLKYKRDLLELKRQLLAVEQKYAVAVAPNNYPAQAMEEAKRTSAALQEKIQDAKEAASKAKLEREEAERKAALAQAEAEEREMKRKSAMFESLLEIARKDKDAGVRAVAVTSMGQLVLDASIDPLLQIALTDTDEKVKMAAFHSLTGFKNQLAVNGLIKLYDGWKESTDRTSIISSWVISEKSAPVGITVHGAYSIVYFAPQNAIDKCVDIVLNDHDPATRNTALNHLRYGKDESASKALAYIYDKTDAEAQKQTIIAMLGEKSDNVAGQKLFEITKTDPNPKLREMAVPLMLKPDYRNAVRPAVVYPNLNPSVNQPPIRDLPRTPAGPQAR